MNREGNPGFTSKWGERHPAIILPFTAEDIEVVFTDAMAAVVEDNFALMYIWYQGQASLQEGETREVTFTCNHIVTDIDEPLIPANEITKVNLFQNYPNPFNPETTISFNLTAEGTENAELIIYNIKGQRIKQFSIDNCQCAKAHKFSIVWDGKDNNGKRVGSGIYFYKLKTGEIIKSKKMLLLK